MRLHARLKRLEKVKRGGRCCRECGFPLDGSDPAPGSVGMVVAAPRVMHSMAELADEPESEPTDWCGACGQRVVFRLRASRPNAGVAA